MNKESRMPLGEGELTSRCAKERPMFPFPPQPTPEQVVPHFPHTQMEEHWHTMTLKASRKGDTPAPKDSTPVALRVVTQHNPVQQLDLLKLSARQDSTPGPSHPRAKCTESSSEEAGSQCLKFETPVLRTFLWGHYVLDTIFLFPTPGLHHIPDIFWSPWLLAGCLH